ncbi:MAG: nucleotidyltransferase domain-containing protein [Desulfobacula sp.]|nr:nucleotidyltransferase domain-containing protein [Desulfobacula sp.]
MDRTEIIKKLKQYKEENQSRYQFSKIGLFGSMARDTNHAGSDIDILVEQKTPDLFMLGTIKTELEEEFGIPIDIIRLHDGINDFLKKRIQQEAIYV